VEDIEPSPLVIFYGLIIAYNKSFVLNTFFSLFESAKSLMKSLKHFETSAFRFCIFGNTDTFFASDESGLFSSVTAIYENINTNKIC
jgi:hypothetical protein